MNVYIDVKNLKQHIKVSKKTTDEYLAMMFINGINEINSVSKWWLPFKLYKSQLSVSTNDTIYRHIKGQPVSHIIIAEKEKIIWERIMLFNLKQVCSIIFANKKNLLYLQLKKKSKQYKIKIPLNIQ